ncbi:MAG: DUF192 domain-containing protein [bacterium]
MLWCIGMKGKYFVLGILSMFVLCVLVVVTIFFYTRQPLAAGHMKQESDQAHSQTNSQPTLPMTQLSISTRAGSTTIAVELATTPQEHQAGLSGRAGLDKGKGMLFVFDPPSVPGFWMKDMRFSLDIIFIDETGNVITIYPNLSPDTYPHSFHPTAPARFVLEVPAGFAEAHAIVVGQRLSF